MRERLPTLTPVALCLAAAVALPLAADDAKPALKAGGILDRATAAYAGCKSYRDTGVVKTTFFRDKGNVTDEKPFKTAFVRPDRFRFEYTERKRDKENRHVVWRRGEQVRSFASDFEDLKPPKSLDEALDSIAGSSGGSANAVPALLLPKEVEGWRFNKVLPKATRIEDAKLDRVDCFRVRDEDDQRTTTVWIDKKTFLVRRIDLQNKFKVFGLRTELTTTYNPVVDEKVPDKELEFDAPKGG